MRVKQLWVIAVGCSLLSAPALASSSHGSDDSGKKKSESIRLKTTKRAELSVLSQRLGDGLPETSKALSKNGRISGKASVAGLPPGLEKKIKHVKHVKRVKHVKHVKHERGPQGGPQNQGTPTVLLPTGTPNIPPTTHAAATPMPEPSALLFFGVGLVVARRAIGRTWR